MLYTFDVNIPPPCVVHSPGRVCAILARPVPLNNGYAIEQCLCRYARSLSPSDVRVAPVYFRSFGVNCDLQTYYWHTKTREVTWDKPPDSEPFVPSIMPKIDQDQTATA